MDNSSFCGTSSEDKSSVAGCDSCLEDHIFVDKLDKQKMDSSDMINDTNHAQMRRSLEEYYVEDGEKEEEDEDDMSEEAFLEEMGYAKSADKIDIMKDHSNQYFDDEEEEEGGEMSIEPIIHKPNTTPTANLNLVSALKGSREKEGKLAKGCRVSWSPDVYDPTPAPPEDFAISKNEIQVREKKSSAGKNQQKKGKGGGGGGGKGKGADKSKGDRQVGKKQRKKHGGGNTSRRHVFDD